MVYFVGAGPGAVDLITVRGAKLLQTADAIVYAGSLVNPELLGYAKKGCAVYDSAPLTLGEVMDILEREDGEGRIVVRLHTGDPSIYGAIKEQMDRLEERKAAYEVVPGVSSFSAAAAALKAEFTLPGVSQTVILSRMEGRTPVPPDEDIEKLASHKASLVLFLTSSLIDSLAAKLVGGGYREDTPAAIVYKATWSDQIVIRTTVAELSASAKEHHITKTALIMVGDFLSSEYETSKLYDKHFTHGFRTASE